MASILKFKGVSLTKKEVNQFIYRELRNLLYRDEEYRWADISTWIVWTLHTERASLLAREIAHLINASVVGLITKEAVNGSLYGPLRDRVIREQDYRWRLKS
jgi:hypothetical protein